MTRPLPNLIGTLSAEQVRVTGEHIAGQQLDSGLIPWFHGHHGDPWDHIEAAMALTVCGLDDAASLAFESLALASMSVAVMPGLREMSTSAIAR